ncbi:MAG TPA: hypothetical protein DCM28_06130 [Phycisphaerales bacterium]|nr:hypothetical protein [Phycisphaerales bacterium]HCD33790.1 hypothetical protein [Phycisphaerales bacterium]|tara:strand:+ start:3363 stop:3836 length:474 start_codon:yes stop_codon:yes gene_type:complete
MDKLNTEQEYQRIITVYGKDDQLGALNLLERQLNTMTQRAQMLLGLCGIVITVTGFSGRIIAGTNRAAQLLIVSGVSITLISAALVVGGVMKLLWITQQPPHEDLPQLIRTTLAYRNRKMRFYHAAVYVLLLGLTCYVIAIAIMLLNPHASTVAPAR